MPHRAASGAVGRWRSAALVLSELDIRDVARPLMREMAADLGETVLLMIPVPDGAVCIENVEGSYPIRLRSFTIGEHVPYNAGAGPLAILAFMAEQEQERILQGSFTSITSSTLTEASLIRKRCSQIRTTGISYSEGEVVAGTSAIASPIFSGGEGEVAGAIVLTGLNERIDRHQSAVRSVAQEITRRLGGDPATFPGNGDSPR
jgi:DNA-binding IclR family transcriptional regulator